MSKPMDMPAAEAARLVRREMPELGRDGRPTGRRIERAVLAVDVFAVAVREGQITVVTTDGQKLFGELPAGKAAK